MTFHLAVIFCAFQACTILMIGPFLQTLSHENNKNNNKQTHRKQT